MVLVSLALSTIYGTGKYFRKGNWYYERAAMNHEPEEKEKNQPKQAMSLKKKKTEMFNQNNPTQPAG